MKLFLASRLVAILLSSVCLSVLAQIPKDVLVQEVGGCAERRVKRSIINDLQPYQPCERPPINTLLIREFANGMYGFYADYSQFATTQSSCTVMGLGKLTKNSIVGSALQFDQKSASEICKVSLTWATKNSKVFTRFEFSELSACSGVCGMNNNVGSITFSGNAGSAFTPSFNCAKASAPAEHTVCLDWRLSKLDFTAAELWEEASGEVTEKQKQISWLRKRNTCGYDASCIQSSYEDRIKELCSSLGRKLDAPGSC